MYTYLLGISHEIHSSESTYIKPSGGTIPLEAFSDSYPCKKPKPSRSGGGNWYLTQTASAKSYEPVILIIFSFCQRNLKNIQTTEGYNLKTYKGLDKQAILSTPAKDGCVVVDNSRVRQTSDPFNTLYMKKDY